MRFSLDNSGLKNGKLGIAYRSSNSIPRWSITFLIPGNTATGAARFDLTESLVGFIFSLEDFLSVYTVLIEESVPQNN